MDMWTATAERETLTHYVPQSAALLDKCQLTYSQKNLEVETVMAAFIDHFAVCLRIRLWDTRSHRGQRVWKLDRQLFEEERGLRLRRKQMRWAAMPRYYPDLLLWSGKRVNHL